MNEISKTPSERLMEALNSSESMSEEFRNICDDLELDPNDFYFVISVADNETDERNDFTE